MEVTLSMSPLLKPMKRRREMKTNWPVLCLPLLIILSGTDNSSKTDAQTHVTWLVMEYLQHHGSPIDPDA